jgi:hypothetical protein
MEWITLYIVYNRHLRHVKRKTEDKPGYTDTKRGGVRHRPAFKWGELIVSPAAEHEKFTRRRRAVSLIEI